MNHKSLIHDDVELIERLLESHINPRPTTSMGFTEPLKKFEDRYARVRNCRAHIHIRVLFSVAGIYYGPFSKMALACTLRR